MPIAAVGLVLGSCVLHAFWNLLFKQARDKLAFTALFLMAAPVIYLPMLLVLAPTHRVPAAGWGCIAATGLLYFGYFAGLARAYQDGELSVAYPLARGAGPAFTLIWGVLLLGERPTAAAVVGMGLVIVAVVALHWPSGTGGSAAQGRPAVRLALASPSTAAALFVALMYSLYSLVDKVGVGRLHIHPGLYIYLTYTASACLVAPWVVRRQGWASIAAEWRTNGVQAVGVGTLNVFAYLLVLWALSLPHTPISYVTPLRTFSVLLGTVFGFAILRERATPGKLAGAVLMAAGVGLIAWKG